MALQVYQQTPTEAPILVKRWQIPFLIVYSYFWNLCRKPLVNYWRHELIVIARKVHEAIIAELLPTIYDNMRNNCGQCRDLYGYLRGETFVSQIKLTLEKARCTIHSTPYLEFLINHDFEFAKSKELGDKICGFVSVEKK